MSDNTRIHEIRTGINRRHFIYTSAMAAATAAMTGCLTAKPRIRSANDKLNIAVIGAAGKGASDTDRCATENIVALCDADSKYCGKQLEKYPKAKFFQDYRKMLDAMSGSIDAVVISTPDHFHGVAASAAMQMGKHVYCQKPLVQTVHEARYLRNLAKKKKVITQMGNQGSAEDGLRRAVECIQAGLIGAVREIHVWSNRPIWPQGLDRPAGSDPVPANLDWDLWLGPAAFRPFKNDVYHPFKWRGWLDFGTGALGDMACHTANMPFRACKLGYPSVVEAEDFSSMNLETYPKTSRIRFEFPSREGLPPVKFWWYDGNPKDDIIKPLRPGGEVTKEIVEMLGDLPGSGCLLIGDKGKIFSPDDYGAKFYVCLSGDREFKASDNHDAAKVIPQVIPRNRFSGGGDERHHLEWIAAIKENNPELCYSRFDIAAYLTEIILLGCIAMRVGKNRPLEWDGPNMRAKNTKAADPFVKREYRKGWFLS